MSNLTRWGGREPLSLREAMDRLIEDSFVRFGDFTFGQGAGLAPMVNVYETGDAIVVEAAIPGMKPEDIDISITGDVLTIKGETRHEPKKEDGKTSYHRQEWRYASFERSLSLPVQVNADRAQTEYENGVLTLTLPKAEAAKAKRLQIKTKK